MYEIFIGERALILCGEELAASFSGTGFKTVVENPSTADLHDLVHRMMADETAGDMTLVGDANELFKELSTLFSPQEAAGGIVVNDRGEILLIFRRGYWDLPKGKLDDSDETIEACAVREVIEETGLTDVEIVPSEVSETYHAFLSKGQWTLKHTYWYIMKADHQPLTPQSEEDIEQAIWVPRGELPGYIDKSYRSLRRLLKGFVEG